MNPLSEDRYRHQILEQHYYGLMVSRRTTPPQRWREGNESFRYRSVVPETTSEDLELSSSAVSIRGTSEGSVSSSGRLTALKRLSAAARTSVVTNILETQNEDDEGTEIDASSFTQTSQPSTHQRNAGPYTILAFVNSASGGGRGKKLFTCLQSHLGPSHVIDLNACHPGNMPEDALIKYAHDPMVRVLACGGDGTCGWIFSSLDKVWSTVLGQSSSKCCVHLSKFKDHLPLAIMPLGTGNDLSRQYGWGGTFQSRMKDKVVKSIQRSNLKSLDRWRCIIMPTSAMVEEEKNLIPKILDCNYHDILEHGKEENTRSTVRVLHSLLEEDNNSSTRVSPSQRTADSKPSTQIFDGVFCNYFSLGFDANIAYSFHQERESHPERFTSPLKNKMVYVQKTPAAFKAPKLKNWVNLMVNNDKGELVKLNIPKSCRAIVSVFGSSTPFASLVPLW